MSVRVSMTFRASAAALAGAAAAACSDSGGPSSRAADPALVASAFADSVFGPGGVRWFQRETDLTGEPFPLVDARHLYYNRPGGYLGYSVFLVARDRATGGTDWVASTGAAGSLAAAGELIVVGDVGLSVLGATTGQAEPGFDRDAIPAADDDVLSDGARVYYASIWGDVVAVTPASRAVDWVTPVFPSPDGSSRARLALSGDALVVATAGSVAVVDAGSGAVRWRQALPGAPTREADVPAVSAGVVAVSAPGDVIRAFDLATGAPRWQYGAPDGSSLTWGGGLAACDGAVVAPTASGVVSLDAASGAVRWRADAGRTRVLSCSYGTALLSLEGDRTRVLDAATGATVRSYPVDGRVEGAINGAVRDDRSIYFTTRRGVAAVPAP